MFRLSQREKKNLETGSHKRITDDAIEILKTCAWSGNVRELGSEIRKAYALADNVINCFSFSSLFENDDSRLSLKKIEKPEDFPTYKEFVEKIRNRLERDYLEKAMMLADGKRVEAARLIDLPYTTYIHKRKSLGLVSNRTV